MQLCSDSKRSMILRTTLLLIRVSPLVDSILRARS